jgi:hypothetical protein
VLSGEIMRIKQFDTTCIVEYILFMGSTTVHIPDEILQRVDAIAHRRGISRNRVVLASLQAEIDRDSGEWPDTFFTAPPADDRELLAEATRDLEAATTSLRKNRGAIVL